MKRCIRHAHLLYQSCKLLTIAVLVSILIVTVSCSNHKNLFVVNGHREVVVIEPTASLFVKNDTTRSDHALYSNLEDIKFYRDEAMTYLREKQIPFTTATCNTIFLQPDSIMFQVPDSIMMTGGVLLFEQKDNPMFLPFIKVGVEYMYDTVLIDNKANLYDTIWTNHPDAQRKK